LIVLETPLSVCFWKAACMRDVHSGAMSARDDEDAAEFSGSSAQERIEPSRAQPENSAWRSTPRASARRANSGCVSKSVEPSAIVRQYRSANTGSMPLETPRIVPIVGRATVVTVAYQRANPRFTRSARHRNDPRRVHIQRHRAGVRAAVLGGRWRKARRFSRRTRSSQRRRGGARAWTSKRCSPGCAREGSIRSCAELPRNSRPSSSSARDIAPEWHVACRPPSRNTPTTAFPRRSTCRGPRRSRTLRKAYLLAYRLKCKGITVYREGSKEAEVLRAAPPVSALDRVPRLNSESCDPRDSTVCRRCPGLKRRIGEIYRSGGT